MAQLCYGIDDMGKPHAFATPSSWVVRFAPLVEPGGAVLDLACGGGRHARLFLDRGHPVTAVDKDIAQAELACGAERVQADLEDGSDWPLPGRRFAAIVVTNYLWRPLFAPLRAALAPDGVLIYETFAAGNAVHGSPRNPAFLLERGELLRLAQGLCVVAYEDGDNGLAVTQRLCAVNGAGPWPLPPASER